MPARSSAAERMRAHRKRRREGSFFVRVELDPPDIDALVRLKFLQQERRADPEWLQVAVRARDGPYREGEEP